MNSIYAKNITQFAARFPDLYALYEPNIKSFSGKVEGMQISESKTKMPTALYNGQLLHSLYDPVREAQKTIESALSTQKDTGVFFGFGLGYTALEFVKNKNRLLILIEPNMEFLLFAFTHIDWSEVFNLQNCIFFIGAPQQSVISLMEKIGFDECAVFYNKAHTAHNQAYFDALHELMERYKQKIQINENTLQKFSHLWLRNICRNSTKIAELDGVIRYANQAQNLSACVLAAGPSLDTVLHLLPHIKKRTILICVDTALRACLSAGVEPHFIVLADPQYWNARHLDGLRSPTSILITETSAYPSVFRFDCREIVLFSTVYPPALFFERFTGTHGNIGAGGSVATTAWDFARLLGCKKIIMAGLDLGFPQNKTHFKGGIFEERVHSSSKRLHPAETDAFNALYGANPYFAEDYNGNPILTDKRFSLFSWWFESKCAEFTQTTTYTLTPQSMKINRIQIITQETLFNMPECQKSIEQCVFIAGLTPEQKKQKKLQVEQALFTATTGLKKIIESAQNGLDFIQEAKKLLERQQSKQINERIEYIIKKLAKIDKEISGNNAKELAELVFPSAKKLKILFEKQQAHTVFEKSECVYTQIIEAAQSYLLLIRRL